MQARVRNDDPKAARARLLGGTSVTTRFGLSARHPVARFARTQPVGMACAAIILTVVIIAVFAPIFAPYGPLEIHRGQALLAPNGQYWLGTDDLGRDVLSRIIYGARISLQVGVVAVAVGTMSGSLIGMTSGYIGGYYDLFIQRVVDALQAFPGLVLAMGLTAALNPGRLTAMIAISIVVMPSAARITRGVTLSLKEEQFVEASRATGARTSRIILMHILPNTLPHIIVLASIVVGVAILIEASLGFLGLGVPPPDPSWGNMLSGSGRRFFVQAPWLAIAPGAAIGILVLAFNLFGDALRDTLDPKLRGR